MSSAALLNLFVAGKKEFGLGLNQIFWLHSFISDRIDINKYIKNHFKESEAIKRLFDEVFPRPEKSVSKRLFYIVKRHEGAYNNQENVI